MLVGLGQLLDQLVLRAVLEYLLAADLLAVVVGDDVFVRLLGQLGRGLNDRSRGNNRCGLFNNLGLIHDFDGGRCGLLVKRGIERLYFGNLGAAAR